MHTTAMGTQPVTREHYVPANQREAAKRSAIEDILRWVDRPRARR